MAHISWKPFDHPQLGRVEIGGWNRFHAFGNPPPAFLEREVARFPKWLLWQALTSPKLELVAAEADALGDDHWRVRLVVQNTGWLPSYVSKRALERKVVRGLIAEIELPAGATLLHGKRREELGQLEGKAYKHTGVSFWPDHNVTDDRAKIEWIVQGRKGDEIRVSRGTSARAWCGRASLSIERRRKHGSIEHTMAWGPLAGRGPAALIAACATPPTAKPGLEAIQHIVVIYAENRSFDHLYGLFPGANGIANATPEQYTQVDYDGTPLPYLPPVWKGKDADPAFPTKLPNRPFQLDAPPINMPLSAKTRDLIHKTFPEQEQINGGRQNRFVEVSDAGALTMGYYDGSKLPMWKWAQEYTLADNFFMGAFGDSFINHFWLVCACTPVDPHAPANLRAQLDERGWLKRRPESPPSALVGPAVFVPAEFTRTATPSPRTSRLPAVARAARRGRRSALHRSDEAVLPPQTIKTIGDTLSAKGVSWAWYSGAWDAAVKDGMQPPDGEARGHRQRRAGRAVLRDASSTVQLLRAVRPGHAGSRAAPQGLHRPRRRNRPRASCRPWRSTSRRAASTSIRGNADVLSGDTHIAELVARIKASPLWASTAIIFTYDENGGLWDHVAPPKGDRWGPGSRIPAIIISPYRQARARRPHVLRYDVDHQIHHAPLRARAAARRARQGREISPTRSTSRRKDARGGATNRIT